MPSGLRRGYLSLSQPTARPEPGLISSGQARIYVISSFTSSRPGIKAGRGSGQSSYRCVSGRPVTGRLLSGQQPGGPAVGHGCCGLTHFSNKSGLTRAGSQHGLNRPLESSQAAAIMSRRAARPAASQEPMLPTPTGLHTPSLTQYICYTVGAVLAF